MHQCIRKVAPCLRRMSQLATVVAAYPSQQAAPSSHSRSQDMSDAACMSRHTRQDRILARRIIRFVLTHCLLYSCHHSYFALRAILRYREEDVEAWLISWPARDLRRAVITAIDREAKRIHWLALLYNFPCFIRGSKLQCRSRRIILVTQC